MRKFETFSALHVPGKPVILFNVWDAGSARVAAKAGARAIATGSASVATAQGYSDAEALPIAMALGNAERIVQSVDLPVSVDFEGGYAVDPGLLAANIRMLAATGVIGCNFEDQVVASHGTPSRVMHDIREQSARIAAMRAATGTPFFINARTDIFLIAKPDTHDAAMVDAAIERGHAYADAGASGFFVPGLGRDARAARVPDVEQDHRLARHMQRGKNVELAHGGPLRSSIVPIEEAPATGKMDHMKLTQT